MKQEDIFKKLKLVVAEELSLGKADKDKITAETNFLLDLGADSLDITMVAMSVEEEFDVIFSDELLEKITTFGDLLNILNDLITKKPSSIPYQKKNIVRAINQAKGALIKKHFISAPG